MVSNIAKCYREIVGEGKSQPMGHTSLSLFCHITMSSLSYHHPDKSAAINTKARLPAKRLQLTEGSHDG